MARTSHERHEGDHPPEYTIGRHVIDHDRLMRILQNLSERVGTFSDSRRRINQLLQESNHSVEEIAAACYGLFNDAAGGFDKASNSPETRHFIEACHILNDKLELETLRRNQEELQRNVRALLALEAHMIRDEVAADVAEDQLSGSQEANESHDEEPRHPERPAQPRPRPRPQPSHRPDRPSQVQAQKQKTWFDEHPNWAATINGIAYSIPAIWAAEKGLSVIGAAGSKILEAFPGVISGPLGTAGGYLLGVSQALIPVVGIGAGLYQLNQARLTRDPAQAKKKALLGTGLLAGSALSGTVLAPAAGILGAAYLGIEYGPRLWQYLVQKKRELIG